MVYVFYDCALDRDGFALMRAGEPAKLEPKVFDVLAYLLLHRDRVVSKLELLDTLWPGEAVSDSVLPRCVAAARKAVGDDRASQRIIQTMHGRGYRFVAPVVERDADPSAPSTRSASPAPPSEAGVFVGREEAMESLRGVLAAAEAGRLRVGLIVGEPGIGKTRLCDEWVAEAGASGFRCLVGRCYEGQGAPAFWPWLQVLRAAFSGAPVEEVAADLGPGAADVAELVPELREVLPGLSAPEGLSGEQARFRLFESVARYLERRARRTPLLVAIDDLHWADEASTLLFEFLAGHLTGARVSLVGTYRDVDVRRDHPLAALLGALARMPQCDRIALHGLADRDVEAFLARAMDAEPSSQLVATVCDMTEGNPFFIQELAQLLVEREASADAGRLSLPQGVRDAIGRRLDALSPACNEMLRVASVIGREFSVPVLEDLLGTSAEALLENVGEALSAGVIVESTEALGRYAFRHALTRQTLYDELRAPRRIKLHRAVGQALERYYGARVDDYVAELAHHYYEAAPGGAAEKAVDYCARAGVRARELLAYEASVRHFGDALEALDLVMPPDDERRCDLLLEQAESQFGCGRRDAWIETCHAAADIARRLGSTRQLARAAIEVRGYGEVGAPQAPETAALLAEAAEAVGDTRPALRAQLLSRMCGAEPFSRSMAERRRLAAEAYALACADGDVDALRAALGARWYAALGPDALEERREVTRLTADLAERENDKRLWLGVWECSLGTALLTGDRPKVLHAIQEHERVARELRQPLFLFMSHIYRGSDELNTGRYAEAERIYTEARELGRGVAPYNEAIYAGQFYWMLVQRGQVERFSLGEELLSPRLGEFPGTEAFLRVMPGISAQAVGDRETAARVLDGFAGDGFRHLERDEGWSVLMGLLADLSDFVGDARSSREIYELLTPYAELMVVHDLLRAVAGSIESVMSELAISFGELDLGIGHIERALAAEEAAELRPAVLSSKVGLTLGLLARDDPGDRDRALALLAAVDEESERLGTHHRLDRKRAEADRLLAG